MSGFAGYYGILLVLGIAFFVGAYLFLVGDINGDEEKKDEE